MINCSYYIGPVSLESITQRWTTSAVDCYRKGCDCSKCTVKEILGNRCKMKKVVFESVRKWGKPNGKSISRETNRD